jgi:hypothetical protein
VIRAQRRYPSFGTLQVTPSSGATRSAQALTSSPGSQGESAKNCCIDSYRAGVSSSRNKVGCRLFRPPCSTSPRTRVLPLAGQRKPVRHLANERNQPLTRLDRPTLQLQRRFHPLLLPNDHRFLPTPAPTARSEFPAPSICSTNAIESLHARFRRSVRARGHFPNEQAAVKCLYLTIRSLDPTGRGRARWVTRWKATLNAFAITFEGRIDLNNN